MFNTDRVEDGGSNWFGSDGAGGSAIIVTRGDAVAGTIRLADGSLYSLVPAGPGVVAVVDVDASQFLPEGEPSDGGGGGLSPQAASIDADGAKYASVALEIWEFAEVGYQELKSVSLISMG